jgi:hypothetical protein
MDPQTFVPSFGDRTPPTLAQSTLERFVKFIAERCDKLFSSILYALEESQRRKAIRLIRRYRHLLSVSDESANNVG